MATLDHPVARALPGLQQMRCEVDGHAPLMPLARTLDIRPCAVELGRVRVRYTPHADHTNSLGLLHAGVHAAVLEVAMDGAVRSTLPAGDVALCVDLSLHFVRQVTARGGPLLAVGKVIHGGRSRVTAEARVTDGSGQLVSHATAAFVVQPERGRP